MNRRSYALGAALVALVLCSAAFLNATVTRGVFGAASASPAYIVMNTPTVVTFTAAFQANSVRRHSILLVRADDTGKPTDIVGRMRDDGRRGDLHANDSVFTLQASLNQKSGGTAHFRVAALFKLRPGETDDDGDWDADLNDLDTQRSPANRKNRLIPLLLRLLRYQLSSPISVDVWISRTDTETSFAYPPGYSLSTSSDGSVTGLEAAAADGETAGFWVFRNHEPTGLSLGDWWRQSPYYSTEQVLRPRLVAGRTALEVVVDPEGFPETHVLLRSREYVYDILIASFDGQLAENILSTFRFN